MTASIDKLLQAGCRSEKEGKICRSRGGESCAFDGAMIVLQPIADAVHVVHGPLACASNSWEGRGSHSSAGDLHKRGFCTNVTELDIVYGAEERLIDTVREAVAECDPSAVFVHATCVTGLTGEDIDATCRAMAGELGLPVVPVHAPGFVGPKNLGNRLAGEALLDHVIGTAQPPAAETTPTDIVLIGEYNVAGDLELIEPVLAAAGINVLTHITGNARFEELRWAHRAKAAAVVCSRALVNVAGELHRRWGVPYVEVSFFGSTEIARSLRAIAALLEAVSPQATGVRARVEAVIAAEESALGSALAPYAALRGKKAVLYSGGVKSWSMVSALGDLGIEVLAVGTKKATHEDEEKVRALMGSDAPVIEDISPARIRRIMAEKGGDMLVAGGRNRYLAAKEGWPFVDVNQERHTAYAGYAGLVNLARDLHHSVCFYDRARASVLDAPGDGLLDPPRITHDERRGAIDPIGNAASLGAVLAFQGVHRAMPVLHGAQGCSFLEKVLLVNHFNESVAVGTTNLFTEEVVMGGSERIAQTVDTLARTSDPDLIAVVTTSLPVVKGDDTATAVRSLRSVLVAGAEPGEAPELICVSTPDYAGGLEDGYLAAVSELVALARPGDVDLAQITILAGSHLTPAESVFLRETAEDFGLRPVMVPDLGALDGSRPAHAALALDGVTVDELRGLGSSAHTLVMGASLEPAARDLAERCETPYTVLHGLSGLAASDRLAQTLSLLSGAPVPARMRRRRSRLVDAMRDAHIEFAGRHVVVASEPDHAAQLAIALREMGARVTCVVPASGSASVHSDASNLQRIPAHDLIVGDHVSIPDDADLVIGGSHARGAARRLGVPHLQLGFPILEHLGAAHGVRIGYEGSTALLNELANLLMDASHGGHVTTGGTP